LLGCNDEEFQINRQNTMNLSVIAPLAGVPQVTMPIKLTESTTTGISFAAAAGNDILLLEFCQSVAKCLL
jgi:amidase